MVQPLGLVVWVDVLKFHKEFFDSKEKQIKTNAHNS